MPVRGDRSRLPRVAHDLDASTFLIDIPSATGELLRELSTLAANSGLKVMASPPVSEPFGTSTGTGVSDIRPFTEEDLLGRRVLDTDVASVVGYVTGKRVLVTGAGGSIGSELVVADIRDLDRMREVFNRFHLPHRPEFPKSRRKPPENQYSVGDLGVGGVGVG